jgi:predicted nucleic acid-binding protein
VRSGPGTAPSGLAEIARASTRLDVRSDPADELIAATSVVHKVPLVTRDRAPRRSRLIPHARRAGG